MFDHRKEIGKFLLDYSKKENRSRMFKIYKILGIPKHSVKDLVEQKLRDEGFINGRGAWIDSCINARFKEVKEDEMTTIDLPLNLINVLNKMAEREGWDTTQSLVIDILMAALDIHFEYSNPGKQNV